MECFELSETWLVIAPKQQCNALIVKSEVVNHRYLMRSLYHWVRRSDSAAER